MSRNTSIFVPSKHSLHVDLRVVIVNSMIVFFETIGSPQ